MVDVIDVPKIDESALGQVIWHSSEEDGGPDVGITLGLGGGKTLWLGEMPKSTIAECPSAARHPDGWWLVVYTDGGTDVIGSIADTDAARELMDHLTSIAIVAAKTVAA